MQEMLSRHIAEIDRELHELLAMIPTPRVEKAIAAALERKQLLEHYQADDQEVIGEAEINHWLMAMQNADGSTGAHWSVAETTAAAQAAGIKIDGISAECWSVAMNMMYSDYFATAIKFKSNVPEFYAHLAHDFLYDKDAKSPCEKLGAYYNHVVNA